MFGAGLGVAVVWRVAWEGGVQEKKRQNPQHGGGGGGIMILIMDPIHF